MNELKRTSEVVGATADLVFEHAAFVWEMTQDWSGPEKVSFKARKTISTLNSHALTKSVRLDSYYQSLLVNSWRACAAFSEVVCNVLGWDTPDRSELDRVENYLLKGKPLNPKDIPAIYTVLNGTSNNLLLDDVAYAYALNSRAITKATLLVFEYVSELRGFILDSTRWRTATVVDRKEARKRVSDLCIEPYCRDIVPIPRKGRCPSCYAWIRKNKQDYYVPYDVVLARLKRKK